MTKAPKKTGAAKKTGTPKKAGTTAPKKRAKLPPALPIESSSGAEVMDRLWAVVMQRRGADTSVSHSARLLSRGTEKVAQKFGEEAVECLIEAVAGRADAMVLESADVLYHLIVLWVAVGVEPAEVWAELHRREGISGIMEKLSRGSPAGTTKIP